MGFSAIPLYLLAGLAFGNGALLPLGLSENFIHIGGEIGVLLLLFLHSFPGPPVGVSRDFFLRPNSGSRGPARTGGPTHNY